MNDEFTIVIAIIFILSMLAAACATASKILNNMQNEEIKIESLRKTDARIENLFTRIAADLVTLDFKKLNKSIYIRAEQYDNDFINAVADKRTELLNICCSDDRFSNDYYNYVNTHYQKPIKQHQLYHITVNFLTNYIKKGDKSQ